MATFSVTGAFLDAIGRRGVGRLTRAVDGVGRGVEVVGVSVDRVRRGLEVALAISGFVSAVGAAEDFVGSAEGSACGADCLATEFACLALSAFCSDFEAAGGVLFSEIFSPVTF